MLLERFGNADDRTEVRYLQQFVTGANVQHYRPATDQLEHKEHGCRRRSGEKSLRHIWRQHGLKPHLVRTFKVSNDPAFSEKLEAIVGLYLNPTEHAIVLCADSKSQIQALDRTQRGLRLNKGRCGTMTHDYKRNGTATRLKLRRTRTEESGRGRPKCLRHLLFVSSGKRKKAECHSAAACQPALRWRTAGCLEK